jgi:hypothetical protein
MTSDRIKEIQKETAYPDSVSVQQALLKVWNECEQMKEIKLQIEIIDVNRYVMTNVSCDSCGCHPNTIYTSGKGRFCERCKPAF